MSATMEKRNIEQCSLCHKPTNKMPTHLSEHHSQILKSSGIIWLNRYEAIYKGKYYLRKNTE